MNLRRHLPPKLSIGNMVKIKEINPYTGQPQFVSGKIGTITEISAVEKSNQTQYKVDFDNEWIGHYLRGQIELYDI